MYSTSKTWVSPKVKENNRTQALNHKRRKFCPNSPFWPENFDLPAHREAWEAGRRRHLNQKWIWAQQELAERKLSQSTHTPSAAPSAIPAPFNGRAEDLSTNRGPVLSLETIFCTTWEKGKVNVAPWPSKSEMKYEGDDRISTDRLHRRFPGLPRIEGNETVSWQHRAPIAQFPFDDFYYPIPHPVEIQMRCEWVEELEVDDEVGEELLGGDLMARLDPRDQWI